MAERILVCGSRGWTHMLPVIERLCELSEGSVVIHGAAKGADRIAGLVAGGLGLTVEAFPADWAKFGKRAGLIRNKQMLDTKPDRVIAFWDGKSPGTKHTILTARYRGIPVEVVSAGDGGLR